MVKSVTFTNATTYLFGVDVNGSALPKESGPPIGLARTHFSMEIEPLNDLGKRKSRVRKFDHLERIGMLKPLYDSKTLALFCYEAIDARKGRIETEDELAQMESRLQLRRQKRAIENTMKCSKRQRMMPMMDYEDDESDDITSHKSIGQVDQTNERRTMAVKFGTCTTYLFDVDYNGSALPKDSGPPIGLARYHHQVFIELVPENNQSCVRKFNHLERLEMLKKLYDAKTIAQVCYEAIDVRKSRIQTEEELLVAESRLRARRLKRAAELSVCVVKRPRMMYTMEYEDDDEEDSSDDLD
ncbi:hypothetical protein THRCLA_23459 [Thraustotheca clavata]|uniref:Uncharacterized protein n=1 Tax=Thraustotheca clavata TaxID=74557 RepID=A0A1V9Y4C2_9STRA|nr:hypothetical protein THRCLA_23459 [Thraustotheca clavata]